MEILCHWFGSGEDSNDQILLHCSFAWEVWAQFLHWWQVTLVITKTIYWIRVMFSGDAIQEVAWWVNPFSCLSSPVRGSVRLGLEWIPPVEGFLKFIVDGAAREELGLAGCGGVLHIGVNEGMGSCIKKCAIRCFPLLSPPRIDACSALCILACKLIPSAIVMDCTTGCRNSIIDTYKPTDVVKVNNIVGSCYKTCKVNNL
ncbi:hypothetical protein GQ457_14G013340 [Hibiscus cannabinus]